MSSYRTPLVDVHQNMSLPPNCTCRMAPAELMRPNVAAPNVAPGLSELTVLDALKIAARMWNCIVRPGGTFFINDRTVEAKLGPLSTLRGESPNVNCAG